MFNSWKIRNNIEVFGLEFAGKKAKKAQVPFDTFYFTIFGRYPRSRKTLKYSRNVLSLVWYNLRVYYGNIPCI